MACHAVEMWSLSGLVAAFLDLTIAYFLLCASAVAYFASKFLGFFGLNLPCPCDGMFINAHTRSLCFDTLLVDFPIQKLSDVHLSIRHKFPFSNSVSPRRNDCDVVSDNCGNGVIELEDEVSCSSSISDARGSVDVVRRELSSRKIDMKGKRVLSSNRPKIRLRKGIGSHGKSSPLFSYEEVIDEDFISNKRGSWLIGDGSPLNRNLEYDKAPKKKRGRLRSLSHDRINLSSDMKKSSEDREDDEQRFESCVIDENRIRLLEQKLENERAARLALYSELEKERSAAASAADEAMAMILRLQEEKAAVGMEARQYRRIIEEKSAYDEEEMNILEEILLRREREKLFLEKEVEAYRQMVYGENEQLTRDCEDRVDAMQIIGDSDENRVLILLNDDQSSFERVINSNESSLECEKATKEVDRNKLAEEASRTCYDVHISEPTEGKIDQFPSLKPRETDSIQSGATQEKAKIITKSPSASCLEIEPVVKKSNRESNCLPPIPGRSLSQILRRSSTSAVDTEMLKIDSEIVQLQERLKLVQEGRGKLGISLEYQESKNSQLRFLEDIARQIQEFRRLNEPKKVQRQASLPPPNSKGLSKKRRSRSASSSGIQISPEES